MATDYEAKKKARVDRLRERSEKARGEGATASNTAHRLANVMQGEPVKIGHHSEGRHRRDIGRMNTAMGKSVEVYRAAQRLEERALAAEQNTAISSDDPEALAKLTERAENLRGQQEFYKAVNVAFRAWKKQPESLDASPLSERVKDQIRTWQPQYSFERQPVPPYLLTNNRANLKRVEERIAHLERAASAQTTEERVGSVRIVDNTDANRLQMFFPGKPAEEARAMLKAAGFHWAPSEGAWQRHRGDMALWRAREIAGKVDGTG